MARAKKVSKKEATKKVSKKPSKGARMQLLGYEPSHWTDMRDLVMGDDEFARVEVGAKVTLTPAEYDRMMGNMQAPPKVLAAMKDLPRRPSKLFEKTGVEVKSRGRSTIYVTDHSGRRLHEVYTRPLGSREWKPWTTKKTPEVYGYTPTTVAELRNFSKRLERTKAKAKPASKPKAKKKTIRQRARCYWFGDC